MLDSILDPRSLLGLGVDNNRLDKVIVPSHCAG